MAIERSSITDGYPIKDINNNEELKYALGQMMQSAVLLEPGDYGDITPLALLYYPYIYNLVVFENGTGMLRMIPKTKSARVLDKNTESGIKLKRGGNTLYLPGTQDSAVIAGVDRQDGKMKIFEYIKYSP